MIAFRDFVIDRTLRFSTIPCSDQPAQQQLSGGGPVLGRVDGFDQDEAESKGNE